MQASQGYMVRQEVLPCHLKEVTREEEKWQIIVSKGGLSNVLQHGRVNS